MISDELCINITIVCCGVISSTYAQE